LAHVRLTEFRVGGEICYEAGGDVAGVGRVHQRDLSALHGDQIATQRPGVDGGKRQLGGVDEGCDDEGRFGRPATVDGGPADAGAGGHAFDGETLVSRFLQDGEGRGQDRVVSGGVSGTARAPRGARGVGSIVIVGGHGTVSPHSFPIRYRLLRNRSRRFRVAL
jgi:hypothetical protein